MKKYFCIAAILVAILLAGCASGNDIVSRSEYEQISYGMSYSQVASIIGYEGIQTSGGTMDGIPGVMPSLTTEMYMWQNSDGSNLIVMFQNDALVNKTQTGLE
jgi:hypothetical protein